MATKSIYLGLILFGMGLIVSIISSSDSVTSFIPSFIGAVFMALGLVGALKPDLNHHMMHGAAMLGLLAILGSLGSLIGRSSTGWALFSQLVTIVLCGGFIVLAVQSFKQARLARQAAEATAQQAI